jgi:hypothetical protein
VRDGDWRPDRLVLRASDDVVMSIS